jgi:hypothetical protein
LVHQSYFSTLVEEVCDVIQLEGFMSIGTLSLKFQLPIDLVTSTVKANLSAVGGRTDTILRVSHIFTCPHK